MSFTWFFKTSCYLSQFHLLVFLITGLETVLATTVLGVVKGKLTGLRSWTHENEQTQVPWSWTNRSLNYNHTAPPSPLEKFHAAKGVVTPSFQSPIWRMWNGFGYVYRRDLQCWPWSYQVEIRNKAARSVTFGRNKICEKHSSWAVYFSRIKYEDGREWNIDAAIKMDGRLHGAAKSVCLLTHAFITIKMQSWVFHCVKMIFVTMHWKYNGKDRRKISFLLVALLKCRIYYF